MHGRKGREEKGPISFDGKPLQLGMLENGLWNTRPGQYDTQGQNIWALVEHYKLSGDRQWLEQIGVSLHQAWGDVAGQLAPQAHAGGQGPE